MQNEYKDDDYDYVDESPPSLLDASGGWWQNVSKKALAIGGAGSLLLVLLLISVFTRGGSDRMEPAQVQLPAYDVMERMQHRFERLEERMEQLEMQLTRLPGLIHQVENMRAGGGNSEQADQVARRVQRLEQRMDQGLEEIRTEIRQIRTRQQQLSTELSERKVTAAAAPAPAPTSAGTTRYHEVKRGDTLFSIARNNGIPLNTLLEKNNLTRDSVIKPGDRLVIR